MNEKLSTLRKRGESRDRRGDPWVPFPDPAHQTECAILRDRLSDKVRHFHRPSREFVT
jgi:hypothetical protein